MAQRSKSSQVAVVGGGVVGLSSAIELARRGREVLVIDRGVVGQGCAIGSAGFIVPSHVIPQAGPGMASTIVKALISRQGALSVKPSLAPAFWRWVFDFTRACNAKAVARAAPALANLLNDSMVLVEEMAADPKADFAFGCRGLLDIHGTEPVLNDAWNHAQIAREHGVEVQLLDGAAVRELEPTANKSVVGGLFYPDDANLHPAQFMRFLTTKAQEVGVEFVAGTDVLGMEGHGGSITRLQTRGGEIQASEVVVATGAATAKIGSYLGERLPLLPGRGLSLTFEAPENGPRIPMLTGDKHASVAPMGHELRLGGWFQLGHSSRVPARKQLAAIEQAVRERLDLPLDMVPSRRWAGDRPVTPDGLPIISRSRKWSNVTVAAGHSMVGLSAGLGTGRLVADIVTGHTPPYDISPFAIQRF